MKRLMLAIATVGLIGFAANTASADSCRYGRGYYGGYRAARVSPYIGGYYGYRGPSYGYGRGYYGYPRYGAGYGNYGYGSGYYGRSGLGYYGNNFSFRLRF